MIILPEGRIVVVGDVVSIVKLAVMDQLVAAMLLGVCVWILIEVSGSSWMSRRVRWTYVGRILRVLVVLVELSLQVSARIMDVGSLSWEVDQRNVDEDNERDKRRRPSLEKDSHLGKRWPC